MIDTTMTKKIVLAAWLLTMTGMAWAGQDFYFDQHYFDHHDRGGGMICPELDPSSMASGLSLLAAGLLVWRGRKGKRPDNH